MQRCHAPGVVAVARFSSSITALVGEQRLNLLGDQVLTFSQRLKGTVSFHTALSDSHPSPEGTAGEPFPLLSACSAAAFTGSRKPDITQPVQRRVFYGANAKTQKKSIHVVDLRNQRRR